MKANPTSFSAYKSGMDAIYAPEHPLHYKEYPLLESQIPIHCKEQVESELKHRSEFYKPEWLSYEATARVEILESLRSRFFVPREAHINLAMQLKRTLFARYHGINIFKLGYFAPSAVATTKQAGSASEADEEAETFARNVSIIGPSGSGKTLGVRICCKLFPQVIIHNRYGDRQLYMKQVCHLRVICPKKSGAKALWTNFYMAFNQALNIQIKMRGWTEAELEEKIAQDVKLSGLGFIVIDEIQNMLFQGQRTEETLAAFTRLNELAGIPLVLIGTPEVGNFIESEMHTARRAAGSLKWKAMGYGEEWDTWLQQVLGKSLLRVPLEWSKETSEYFFDSLSGLIPRRLRRAVS